MVDFWTRHPNRPDEGTHGCDGRIREDGETEALSLQRLDDWDFITYFTTSKLDDFNNLVTGLLGQGRTVIIGVFGDPSPVGDHSTIG